MNRRYYNSPKMRVLNRHPSIILDIANDKINTSNAITWDTDSQTNVYFPNCKALHHIAIRPFRQHVVRPVLLVTFIGYCNNHTD